MDTKKLLGLLFEHIESNDIVSFDVYHDTIFIEFKDYSENLFLKGDILTQYNKIFSYES